MFRFAVIGLPEAPLAAAARFHDAVLPEIVSRLSGGESLMIVFPEADHTHTEWRLAAVAGLAREYAPRRVNAVASNDETAIAAALHWLAAAPGITGQYYPLDAKGAVGA